MHTSGRGPHRRLVAVATALLGAALLVSGCSGGSSSGGATPAPASQPPASGAGHAQLAALATCLRQHGLVMPSQPTAADVRTAFQSLSADQRTSIVEACRGLLPSGLAASLRARASATP